MDTEILVMEYGDLMGFNDDDDSKMSCFVLCWLEHLTLFVWVEKGTVEVFKGYNEGKLDYGVEFSVCSASIRYGSNVNIMWFMGFSTVQGYGWVLAAHGVVVMFLASISFNMAASSSQNGIQLLLAAEQEAQHIVNAARTAKQARLKQAKEEAEREIAEFRAQVEAEFQRKLAESSGDSGANVKRLEVETDEKIQHLKTEASRISPDVVSMLLRHVTTVKN
ncbi:UNVERIFIED_CONTAM: V-type proton ATPase subunit G 1 [Sesamum calycinum]|uniref:V-type proton ATPase subunit G 1 n=2 Tax=Sesamum TaxID=4181 RepID=A0AAW2LSS2_9LAMI